ECAGSLSRRAAMLSQGRLHEKASQRFDVPALKAIARSFAREAALKVAVDGLRGIAGAGGMSEPEVAAFEGALGMPAILAAQAGLLSDMDFIADALYDRVPKAARAAA
ncbi:MAG TPA: acyl-CoA dehydrogenase, partial [Terriglobia bacterium]|nr:acyl-CoA dehydrogenase [Terriglobia bacterium]